MYAFHVLFLADSISNVWAISSNSVHKAINDQGQ